MSFFSHLFDSPSYLQLPIFGLDISDRSFKYIKLAKAARGFYVEDYGDGAFPAGLVANGVVGNEARLAEVLHQALSGKPYRHAALSLPEEKGFVRTIHMPRIAPEELREALTLQMEEHIPLPPDDIAFDYHVLPGHNEQTMDVLIAAFPASLLAGYIHVAEQAGLVLVALEIESQAIARAVIPPAEQQNAVLVIDIGLTRTSFLFARGGYAQMTSTIPLGGETMHTAIAKNLSVDRAKAEQLKIQHGLSRAHDAKPVFEALLPIVQKIKEEIQRRAKYWLHETSEHQKTKGSGAISRVYLCGRDANLIGLPRHLSSQLGMPVEIANVWSNTIENSSYIPEIEFRDSLGYATSIGLALGTM